MQGQLQCDNFDGNLWLLLTGNKVRKHIKFHFQITNCKDSGSVYNVHIFATYEGADSQQNMANVPQKFPQDMENCRVRCFLHVGFIIFLGDE